MLEENKRKDILKYRYIKESIEQQFWKILIDKINNE